MICIHDRQIGIDCGLVAGNFDVPKFLRVVGAAILKCARPIVLHVPGKRGSRFSGGLTRQRDVFVLVDRSFGRRDRHIVRINFDDDRDEERRRQEFMVD